MNLELGFVLIVTFSTINCLSLKVSAQIENSDLQTPDIQDISSIEENVKSNEISNIGNKLLSGNDQNEANENMFINKASDSPPVPDSAELEDMVNGGLFENRTVFAETEDADDARVDLPPPEADVAVEPIASNARWNFEWIESSDGATFDVDAVRVDRPEADLLRGKVPLVVATAAIATAFVLFLVGSVVFYKLLMKRYKNRRILINEEDMIDPNDMKNFSVKEHLVAPERVESLRTMPKALSEDERKMVLRLLDYFRRERDNSAPLLPLTAVHERAANALQISMRTVARINKEGIKRGGNNDGESVKKQPRLDGIRETKKMAEKNFSEGNVEQSLMRTVDGNPGIKMEVVYCVSVDSNGIGPNTRIESEEPFCKVKKES